MTRFLIREHNMMNRRTFFTRSAALAALSALPTSAIPFAIEPKTASGLIQGLSFDMNGDPIRLVLDGPLHFLRCEFMGAALSGKPILSVLDGDTYSDAFFQIQPNGHHVVIERCIFRDRSIPQAWFSPLNDESAIL